MKDFNCESCIHKEVCAGYEVTMPECKHYRPAVDAVEVVRCGECEFIDDKCAHGIVCICDHGGMCGTFVADTDFCSCGKRRMDGE